VGEFICNPACRRDFRNRQQGRVFIYSKVAVARLDWVRLLEEAGFHLIDTNVTLARPVKHGEWNKKGADLEIRFATPEDEEETTKLAGKCFTYSRFHLDQDIRREKADAVKARWAGNFFRGKRGDFMVIARKGGAIAGFLQLLRQENTLIIDLIGVGANHRRTGVGAMLIAYAEEHCGVFEAIRVGTQVANTSSLRFYERQGFRLAAAIYVFHFHGKGGEGRD